MAKSKKTSHLDVEARNIRIEVKSTVSTSVDADHVRRADLPSKDSTLVTSIAILMAVFVSLSKEGEEKTPSSAILSALLPADISEDVIANMQELYTEKWVPRHGVRKARWIWRTQAASLIFLQWAAPILNLADKVRGLSKS